MGGFQSIERSADQSYSGRARITEIANFDFRNESLHKTTSLERCGYRPGGETRRDSWLQQEEDRRESRSESLNWHSFYDSLDASFGTGFRSNKSSTSSRVSTLSSESSGSPGSPGSSQLTPSFDLSQPGVSPNSSGPWTQQHHNSGPISLPILQAHHRQDRGIRRSGVVTRGEVNFNI